jgi:hypothetical protein
MFHLLAFAEGPKVANGIARAFGWKLPPQKTLAEDPEGGDGFSQSDFEAALRKASLKIAPK